MSILIIFSTKVFFQFKPILLNPKVKHQNDMFKKSNKKRMNTMRTLMMHCIKFCFINMLNW